MTIQLHIEADNVAELLASLKAIGQITGEVVVATPEADKPRRGRPPGTTNKAANDAGTGAATTTPAAAAEDPLDMGGNKPNGQAADDIFGDDKPAGQPAAAAAPAFKTPEDFIEAVKKLLGKGKDDAVRGKLKELGFEKVRDVPPDKYTSTLAELGKV